MTDPRVLDALDIPRDADEVEVARGFRRLLGLAPDSADPALWTRLLERLEGTIGSPAGGNGDGAQLANSVVMSSVAPTREGRWGYDAWARELGMSMEETDTRLWELVGGTVAERLARAGLYRLL